MLLRPGSLLIAHPLYSSEHCRKHVVFITESTALSTMGITLNNLSRYDLRELMQDKGVDWPGERELWIGGTQRSTAMVMLHTSEWYSSNTLPVDHHFSISSDTLMIDKISDHNTPEWYKLFVGCVGWAPHEITRELRGTKPRWLYLAYPSTELIEGDGETQWDRAIAECSQDLFNEYF